MWKTQFNCKCGNQHNLVLKKEEYVTIGEALVFNCPVINKRILFTNIEAWSEEFETDSNDIIVNGINKRS